MDSRPLPRYVLILAGIAVLTTLAAADNTAANGPGAHLLGEVALSAALGASGERKRFKLTLPDSGRKYWVRPSSPEGVGSPSNLVDLEVKLKAGSRVLSAATLTDLTGFDNDGRLTFGALAAGRSDSFTPDDDGDLFTLRLTDTGMVFFAPGSGATATSLSGSTADCTLSVSALGIAAVTPLLDLESNDSPAEDWAATVHVISAGV